MTQYTDKQLAAIRRKPQYKIYDEVREDGIKSIAQTLVQEYILTPAEAKEIAEKVVDEAIAQNRGRIKPGAPDAFLTPNDYLKRLETDCWRIINKMHQDSLKGDENNGIGV